MNIGSLPRLFRGAAYPAIYGTAGTHLIDTNEVSVTTPEATLMSQTLPTSLFTTTGVCIEIESWFQLSGGNTLYLDIDGTLAATLSAGSVSMRNTITLVKRASDYLYQVRSEYLSAPNPSPIAAFTPAGSTFTVLFRGTNVTQKLMRNKVWPI